MRLLLVAGLIGLSGAAHAQERVVVRGPGASYPPPGATVVVQPAPAPVAAPYRRPMRGEVLPPTLTAGGYVPDWASYGLPQPPVGYNWVRYGGDAVLVDARGAVFDVETGVDWGRAGQRAGYAPYPSGTYDLRGYRRRDSGLGGAAVGAVAGGALGAVVAGRGDRLGGALIGGGVGAVTGYAIDRAEDRGRAPPPPPGYGAGYPLPPGYHDDYAGPEVRTYMVPAGGSHTVFVGPGVTTVTVTTQPAVTTTTTTTEYRDEVVTYTTPARRVHRPVNQTKTMKRLRR